jgi:two-component system cell cycle response regulator DivK
MGYILLIEDNKANADMTIHILTSAGYTVQHFLRGLEGAQQARRVRPDLILMDFDLPDVNGRSLTLVLKKQLGGHTAPPVIAVTAKTGDYEMRIAEKFGCDAFVSKPFTPDQLLAVIEKMLKSRAASAPPAAPQA